MIVDRSTNRRWSILNKYLLDTFYKRNYVYTHKPTLLVLMSIIVLVINIKSTINFPQIRYDFI